MSDPATCQPPNPEVSGWWWLTRDGHHNLPAWWYHSDAPGCSGWTEYGTPEQMAAHGYRVLGPVLSFAEVEALRDDIAGAVKHLTQIVSYHSAEIEPAKSLHGLRWQVDNLTMEIQEARRDLIEFRRVLPIFIAQLAAANAEIERLKRYIAGAHRCLEVDDNKTGALQTLKSALENEDV